MLGLIDPKILGIDWLPLPVGPTSTSWEDAKPQHPGPMPGWHVVSVNKLQDSAHQWDYYEQFTPVGWISYTMKVYHLSIEDCNTMRKKYAMPLLPLTPPTTQPTPTTSETQGGTHDRNR